MVQYIKASLYAKSNGALACRGVLVKSVMETNPNTANFFFVYKNGELNLGGTDGSAFHFGNNSELTLSTTNGALMCVGIFNGTPVDSFQTLIISERLRTDSTFNNYRVQLGREILTGDGVFAVDFDDLFEQEAIEAINNAGVLIKTNYTQTETYAGFSSYHHNQHVHRFNTPLHNDKNWRIGVELEVYARTEEAYRKITTARTNWFQCESDSSLSQHAWPIEMKTIPLSPADATSVDFWAEPMSKLAALAVSKGFSSTGLHVHISKEILGTTESERQNNLNKLITFYTYYVEDDINAKEKNKIICGRAQGYHANPNGAKTELGNFAKLIGINKIAENELAFNLMADSVKTECQGQRGDINIGNWNTYGTIEFRKGDGRISKTRLAAICSWWETMCLYCKETHPRDFSFDVFFSRVCREHPCVAYFFQQDDEC